MADVMVSVKHLNAFYREGGEIKQILRDVSFTLNTGEIVGLVGESGIGKTTLCKAILGLLPDVDGEIVCHSPCPQMIFQDPYGSLNPTKRVRWLMEEPLRVLGKDGPLERQKKVSDMLERIHLSPDLLDRYPRELSGGQRQRVSLGISLLTGTKLILADEPFSALDVTVQADLIDLIQELQQEDPITYLFVSHDRDVVSLLCDRVLILTDQQVQWLGEKEGGETDADL